MINLRFIFLCFPLFVFWCLFFVFMSITKNKALLPGGKKRSESGRWLQGTNSRQRRRPGSSRVSVSPGLTLSIIKWKTASISSFTYLWQVDEAKIQAHETSRNHTSSLLLHRCHFDPRIITHQSFPGRKRGRTSQRPDSESWFCYCLTKGKSFLSLHFLICKTCLLDSL